MAVSKMGGIDDHVIVNSKTPCARCGRYVWEECPQMTPTERNCPRKAKVKEPEAPVPAVAQPDAPSPAPVVPVKLTTPKIQLVLQAKAKGYTGDSCNDCQNFTMVRNGTCLKCDSCGSTSGCS